jgi:chemotaxis protein CheX
MMVFSVARLVDITKELFEKMVGLKLEQHTGSYEDAFSASVTDISSLVGMSGTAPGIVAVHSSRVLAKKVTAGMLGMKESELSDAEVNDGYGEVANIIAGNIKKEMESQKADIKLSLPTVVTGKDYSTKILNGEKTDEVKIRVVFSCEGEKLFVEFIFQGELKIA